MFKCLSTLYSLIVLAVALPAGPGCMPATDDRPRSDGGADGSAFDLGGEDAAEDSGPDLDAKAFAELCQSITDMEECVAAGCVGHEKEFRRYSEAEGCREPTTRTLCLPWHGGGTVSTCWWRELENGEFETFSDGTTLEALNTEVWTVCSDEGEFHPACDCNPSWGAPR